MSVISNVDENLPVLEMFLGQPLAPLIPLPALRTSYGYEEAPWKPIIHGPEIVFFAVTV